MAKSFNTSNVTTSNSGLFACPKCGASMIPMSTGKGFRCSKGSVRKVGGSWITSGCDGVVWNNNRQTFVKEKTARADTWPVILKPTEEQEAIDAYLSKSPAARGGRCLIINAGPGTAKTTSLSRSAKRVWERLGELTGFGFLAFNANARDVLLSKLPLQVPDVHTMNSWTARQQGYQYRQYEAGKVRRIFKEMVEHLPKDERPKMGIVGKMVERMRDICLFNPNESDTAWWKAAIEATCGRFPSLASKYRGQEEHAFQYVPAVACQAQRETKTIDIQEQVSRPVTNAIERSGWKMPWQLTDTGHVWEESDIQEFCRLIKAIQLPQVKGLIIDEGQDLSLCQIAVFLSQVWRNGELVIIGDDRSGEPGQEGYKAGQAIYGWRGAFGGSLDLIARLWKELTGETVKRLDLTITFRCGPEIVEAFRPLNTVLQSKRSAGESAAWEVGEQQAFNAWLGLPKEKRALWITRTNAPLAPLFLETIRNHEEVTLRSGDNFAGQIDGTLYNAAGWYDDNGEYRASFDTCLTELRRIITEESENSPSGESDPNSLEKFILEIGEALETDPALLDKAELKSRELTVGNLRRFILFFANRSARRCLTTVYRCKGDEADLVIVSDSAKFNESWGDDNEAAACRHVALSRAKDMLLTVGYIAGSVISPAPSDEITL